MNLSDEDRIKRCMEKHPEWKPERVGASLNLPFSLCRLYKSGAVNPGDLSNAIPSAPKAPGIISLDKLREKFDFSALIMAELARLPRGKLISEQELCQRVTNTDRVRFRRTVENNAEQFRALRIKLKLDEGEGKWFWGNKDDVAEALRIRDL